MKKLTLLAFIILSYKSIQSNPQKDRSPVITMKKTECYGRCPVYTLIIYNDQKAKLVGERFLDLIGTYRADVPQAVYDKLIKAFEDADFFNFENEYNANILDFPITYLSFSRFGKTKTVIDQYQAPPPLKNLERQVATLVKSLNWR